MQIKDKIEGILQKEVSRKEFLQHVGFALLAVVGVSGLIESLLKSPNKQQSIGTGHGYGGNVYGGRKKN